MTTQKLPKIFSLLLLSTCGAAAFCHTALSATAEDANPASLAGALSGGKIAVNLRYRAEIVDQKNLQKDALATTLKTRLNWQSASYRGFTALVEMDDVSALGNDAYNSTINGNGEYPIVADPVGTELNRAQIQYQNGNSIATAGRQRINLDGQRFVGGVGWRQNEQTYDGYRYQYGAEGSLQLDYSYVYRVNRIFGEDSANSDFRGNIQLLHAAYPVVENHKLAAFFYELDIENAINASSRTLGVDYKGSFGPVTAHLSVANQTETGGSRLDYSAPYYLGELATAFGPVKARLGYEVLGADNGVGFATPLATLHKFQGFADKFLGTPANGVEDLYLGGAMKLVGGNMALTYHSFSASESSQDYGSELDISYGRKINKQLSFAVKYAVYNADEYSADTDKLWLMVTARF